MALFDKISRLFGSKKEEEKSAEEQPVLMGELREEIVKITEELEQIQAQLQAGTGDKEALTARARELVMHEKELLEAHFPRKEN